jgi:hypothetical protein
MRKSVTRGQRSSDLRGVQLGAFFFSQIYLSYAYAIIRLFNQWSSEKSASMTKKRKKSKKLQVKFIRLALCGAALLFGGLVLAFQLRSHLVPKRPLLAHHAVAVVIAAKSPSPTIVVYPKPVVVVAPVATKTLPVRVPSKRLAVVPKSLPAVTAVPGSAVGHLVAVAPASAPLPAVSPTPGLGRGSGSPDTPSPTPTPTPPPSAPSAYYTSTNWSGYMSPAGNFTGLSGSWKVPKPTGNGHSTTADAAWIGIGGVTSNDLIQVGTTDFVSSSGQLSTAAFYELLPDSETIIPSLSIASGDIVTASLQLNSGDQWQITLADVTANETFTLGVTYTSSLSSAEWIEEDPSFASGGLVPFDHFGTISFTGSQATSGGVTQTAAAAGAQAIIMVDSGGNHIATPSNLAPDGQSFTVTGS